MKATQFVKKAFSKSLTTPDLSLLPDDKILDEAYFSSCRNELTEERFSWLETAAQQIPTPDLFGTFSDNKHYLDTLDILMKSTMETAHRDEFFRKQILPQVKTQHMLDVGIADGHLTRLAGKKFESITLVDPKQLALDSVDSNCFENMKNLRKICGSITDVELPHSTFDLAIMSHILYYLEPAEWFNTVAKIFNSLQPGGLLALAITWGLDKKRLALRFGGRQLEIDDLITHCKHRLGAVSVETYSSHELFQTSSLNTLLHVAGIFLNDVKATATKKELLGFLRDKKNLYTPSIYQLSAQQKFILIRKSGGVSFDRKNN